VAAAAREAAGVARADTRFMDTQDVTFINRSGIELAGLIDRPDGREAVAWALFAHCFTCGKDLKPFYQLSRGLTDAGLAVLRFDFTGLGESAGEFADSNLTTGAADLVDAARFLEKNFAPPALLIGHSFGGTSVVKAAREIPSARAVVTIASAADPDHLGRKLAQARLAANREGSARLMIGGQNFTLKKQFFEDLEANTMADDLAHLRRALLVMHSPNDETVSIDNAARIFQTARHPKSFVVLPGADHLMLDPHIAYYAGTLIGAWSGPYISSNE